MRVTGPQSRHFDRALVVEPERRGAVAWSQFNRAFEELQTRDWSTINRGTNHPWWRRLQRLSIAWYLQRTQALLDLEGKARALSAFPVPRDPDIVFYGAEVGWEAALAQSLYGDGGRVVLVDCDPIAYERHLSAPRERQVRGPDGPLLLRRDPDRITYVREDFFEWEEPGAFDLGIDWGLIEHYPGDRKRSVVERMRKMLRAGGHQISAVPRNTMNVRLFYQAFRDELNFGYRELLSQNELAAELAAGGFEVVQQEATSTTCIAFSRA